MTFLSSGYRKFTFCLLWYFIFDIYKFYWFCVYLFHFLSINIWLSIFMRTFPGAARFMCISTHTRPPRSPSAFNSSIIYAVLFIFYTKPKLMDKKKLWIRKVKWNCNQKVFHVTFSFCNVKSGLQKNRFVDLSPSAACLCEVLYLSLYALLSAIWDVVRNCYRSSCCYSIWCIQGHYIIETCEWHTTGRVPCRHVWRYRHEMSTPEACGQFQTTFVTSWSIPRLHVISTRVTCNIRHYRSDVYPDSKVHGANMGHTWVLSAPDGLHVGPMDLAIMIGLHRVLQQHHHQAQSCCCGYNIRWRIHKCWQVSLTDRMKKKTFSSFLSRQKWRTCLKREGASSTTAPQPAWHARSIENSPEVWQSILWVFLTNLFASIQRWSAARVKAIGGLYRLATESVNCVLDSTWIMTSSVQASANRYQPNVRVWHRWCHYCVVNKSLDYVVNCECEFNMRKLISINICNHI